MDRGRAVGSRQACSLLLLTATLVGSCVALAVKTLIESGSGMLLVLLALGFLASNAVRGRVHLAAAHSRATRAGLHDGVLRVR